MKKPVESSFPLQELIRERWSPLALTGKRIPAETLGSLFEAARWAPSSYNEQPWVFLIATQDQPDEFQRMASCLVEANRVWAQRAYCLAISCAKLDFARNGKPNRHAYHDVGLATQNLFIQAQSLGIACHPMAGFDPLAARELFQIPANVDPVAAMAIGYQADDLSGLDDGLKQRELAPRIRKPLTDVVYTGTWGRFAGPFG